MGKQKIMNQMQRKFGTVRVEKELKHAKSPFAVYLCCHVFPKDDGARQASLDNEFCKGATSLRPPSAWLHLVMGSGAGPPHMIVTLSVLDHTNFEVMRNVRTRLQEMEGPSELLYLSASHGM